MKNLKAINLLLFLFSLHFSFNQSVRNYGINSISYLLGFSLQTLSPDKYTRTTDYLIQVGESATQAATETTEEKKKKAF